MEREFGCRRAKIGLPDDAGRWLINLEELPSAVQMGQAAVYQLVLDRKVGEYELPEGASLIACGNRESDRVVVHRMPTPLASRFVHLEIKVVAQDWLAGGRRTESRPSSCFSSFCTTNAGRSPLRRDGTPDSSMGGAADHGSISLG